MRARFLDVRRQDLAGFTSIHHRDEMLVGVADPRVQARVQPFVPETLFGATLSLSLGATVPLGATEPDPFALGRRGLWHQHLFFGAGRPTLLGGADLVFPFEVFSLPFRVGASGSAVVAILRNEHDYRAPSLGSASVFVDATFGLRDFTFRIEPGLFVETPADYGGEAQENSGRVDVLTSGAVFYRARDDLELMALAQVVLWRTALGGQLFSPLVVVIGARFDVPLPR